MSTPKRIAVGFAGLALAVLVIGGGHGALVRWGVLARKSGGTCPFGYGSAASPAEAHAAEVRRHATQRGATAAAARPALDFTLDVTTPDDIRRWASALGVTCISPRGPSSIACEDIPHGRYSAQSPVDVSAVWFAFNSAGTLASIRVMRRDASPEKVMLGFNATTSTLDTTAGAPIARTGPATPNAIAAGTLAQAAAEYRFTNYYAVVRATNMGHDFTLTEEYASLID